MYVSLRSFCAFCIDIKGLMKETIKKNKHVQVKD